MLYALWRRKGKKIRQSAPQLVANSADFLILSAYILLKSIGGFLGCCHIA
jgi:hypothetical protein